MNKMINKIQNKLFWARYDFRFWKIRFQLKLSSAFKIFKLNLKMLWKCVILGIPKLLIAEAVFLKGKITGKYLPRCSVEELKQARKELVDIENVVNVREIPLFYRPIYSRCVYLAKTTLDNELVNRIIAA